MDGCLLDVCHVPEDGEDQHAGQEAGQCVHDASDDGISRKLWKMELAPV